MSPAARASRGDEDCQNYRRLRKYAAEQGVTEGEAVKRGREEKAAEFAKAGEVYQKV
jgi:hypothetical protein